MLEEENKASVGQKIVLNIRNTMSDRARTENHFNKLLHDYKYTILPVVV